MSLVLTCLLLPISTGAELATDERLAEEGSPSSPCETTPLTATKDGDIDAVRVVVVEFNSGLKRPYR